MDERARKTVRAFAALMVLGGLAAGVPLALLGWVDDDAGSLVLYAGLLLIAYAVAAVRMLVLTRPRQDSNLEPTV